MIKRDGTKEDWEIGFTYYEKLIQDDGLDWNVMVRPGGTVSVYATGPRIGAAVGVAIDTFDNVYAEGAADKLIARLSEMKEVIEIALSAAKTVQVRNQIREEK